jgi:hypothetical protein
MSAEPEWENLLSTVVIFVITVLLLCALPHVGVLWKVYEKILENRPVSPGKSKKAKLSTEMRKTQKKMREKRLRSEARQRS